ncbi:MAG: hypothetical protein IBX50_12820 [Marinospirillum sp.]|uniref:hypothetical protein n=1 Tax=Marinospirillum sp. TaxID=2183934 RepID=UPI0019F0063B|nr:hypothetical protein [Marinospirillum sp.]MBE0507575.1 hypothetical protein [Marinospirillum sp.]
MAHDVSFSVPSRPLGKSDIEFIIKNDGNTLGTLKISNGSVVWFPSGTTYGHRMRWSKFDKMMKENATDSETR